MDWLAGITALYCTWLQGNKKAYVWILSFFCQFIWLYVEYKKELYGFMVVTIPMIFLCIRNYRLWKND